MAQITKEEKRAIIEDIKDRIKNLADHIRYLSYFAEVIEGWYDSYHKDLIALKNVVRNEVKDPVERDKLITEIDRYLETWGEKLSVISREKILPKYNELRALANSIENKYKEKLEKVI